MRGHFAIVLALLGGCDGCRARPGPDPAAAAASTLREAESLAAEVAADAGPPCARAYEEIGRLRARLDAGPPADEASFLAGCQTLPEEVQQCLRPSYVASRPEDCAVLVEALPEPERAAARDLARLR